VKLYTPTFAVVRQAVHGGRGLDDIDTIYADLKALEDAQDCLRVVAPHGAPIGNIRRAWIEIRIPIEEAPNKR